MAANGSTHRRSSWMSRRLARENIFEDSAKNESQIAVLQELDKSKYNQIKQSWLSRLQEGSGSSRELSACPRVESLSDDLLISILPPKIRAHIFNSFPLRVIKLPEMELMDRNAVAEYIIHNKARQLTEQLQQQIGPFYHAKWQAHSQAVSESIKDVTKFAVLSHTWGPDEPNHEDFLLKRNAPDSRGYKKLEEFCRISQQQFGVEFVWADTVCINKSSSSELDESIRSMFTWYRESFICIIHLADTENLLDFPFDRWFTRGWTLQELLAPLRMKFYNQNWKQLTNLRNEKLDPNRKLFGAHRSYTSNLRTFDEEYSLQLELLGDGLSTATGVPIHYICDFKPGLQDPPLPERMKWMAKRMTTRPEDMAYSMMGVLGVSLSVAYGEGLERAFFRLFQAVLEVDWSPSWFLWGGKPIPPYIHPSKMIPSSPACYLSWDLKPVHQTFVETLDGAFPQKPRKKEPLSLTNTGLPIKVLVVPAKFVSYIGTDGIHGGNITCPLSDDTIKMAGIPRPGMNDILGVYQFALGILDYDFEPQNAPERIYAILLYRRCAPHWSTAEGSRPVWRCTEWERCETGEIISFGLNSKFRNMTMDDWTTVAISRTRVGWNKKFMKVDLGPPKIEFRTLYL